jgi:acyl-CoA thioester hydrolase
MAYEFRHRRLVQYIDTDAGGIIHFTNYFRYMEETETAFYRSVGVNLVLETSRGTSVCPRVSASCDFKKTVTFGDELDIHLWVIRKGRSSVGYEFSFQCREEEVAHGKLIVAWVTKQPDGSIKSSPIPKPVDEALEVAPFPSSS